MERLTNKKEADAQRREYENRLKNGYPRNIPEERFLKLAAYEDTGLEPEEITTEPYGCVFYCNRKCNLDGDWCAEGPGCRQELNAETAQHLLKLAQAEKDGQLVVLQEGATVRRLQEEYHQAKHMADERLPSPDYTTGRIAGFGAGVIHILDKILTREEADAALKKREEADNEAN